MKPCLAFYQKHLPGDGGRIFNEPALRSFMRSRAALHQDASYFMPLQYSGSYATADHDQVDAGGRSIGEDRVTE
jgi:hypothetical protein